VQFDLLVLSPHADDAAFSVGGRLAEAARAGQRIGLLTVCRSATWQQFADGQSRAAEDVAWAERLGLVLLPPVIDDAPLREPRYASGRRLMEWIDPTHPVMVKLLDHFASIDAPRVLAPLGIGEHVDHQLVHWAARHLRGRQVEYYEDSPYVLMPGLREARLQNLGAARDGRPAHVAAMRAWTATPLVQAQSPILRPFVAWALCQSLRRRLDPVDDHTTAWSAREHATELDDRLAAIACYPTQWPLFYPSLDAWRERLATPERYWTCTGRPSKTQ